MKTLNQQATKIFCVLLDGLRGKPYIKLENEPYMPLSLECIGELYGQQGKLYSLAHYYEQYGDLMADPEMCFIVIDQREDDKAALSKIMIVPYLYKQDNIGIYQESMAFANDVVSHCKTLLQEEQVAFANQWLSNIREQGFVTI